MQITREAPTHTSWKLPLCHPHGHCPALPLIWEGQHRFCSFQNFSFILQISFKGLREELILHTCASGEMATVPGQGINTPFKVILFILSFQQTNQIQHLAMHVSHHWKPFQISKLYTLSAGMTPGTLWQLNYKWHPLCHPTALSYLHWLQRGLHTLSCSQQWAGQQQEHIIKYFFYLHLQ